MHVLGKKTVKECNSEEENTSSSSSSSSSSTHIHNIQHTTHSHTHNNVCNSVARVAIAKWIGPVRARHVHAAPSSCPPAHCCSKFYALLPISLFNTHNTASLHILASSPPPSFSRLFCGGAFRTQKNIRNNNNTNKNNIASSRNITNRKKLSTVPPDPKWCSRFSYALSSRRWVDCLSHQRDHTP